MSTTIATQQPRARASSAKMLGRAGTGLAGAAVLAFSAALPAHAQTEVTSGHADVIGVNSAHEIGSNFGSDFAPWGANFDYQFVFDDALNQNGVTCSNGVITIDGHGINSNQLPDVGLDNSSNNPYLIDVSTASGSPQTGDVSFSSSLSDVLSTDGPPVELPSSAHVHGDWEFVVGSCAAGESYVFELTFEAEGQGGVGNFDEQGITFVINS
ncbi:hypothetical protein [Nesterenkonia haasae]|uniref:hypothetical protein n=1 Tax=Nesterenkonia haasae TaxID=2587813 RepID=UPI001390E705|nr:hypothetical protein [Nesterenkonia haasae]NDK33152.1 hypothetical protein [Nesterenkonia haasae]